MSCVKMEMLFLWLIGFIDEASGWPEVVVDYCPQPFCAVWMSGQFLLTELFTYWNSWFLCLLSINRSLTLKHTFVSMQLCRWEGPTAALHSQTSCLKSPRRFNISCRCHRSRHQMKSSGSQGSRWGLHLRRLLTRQEQIGKLCFLLVHTCEACEVRFTRVVLGCSSSWLIIAVGQYRVKGRSEDRRLGRSWLCHMWEHV